MTEEELPKTYKAAIYDKVGSISTKIVDLEMPEPGPGEVLIKLSHSGVCHSDIGVMTSNWKSLPMPTGEDQVGGHEGVGVVVKLGPGALEQGLKLGDRVGIKWVAGPCWICPPCLSGHDGVCPNAKISGYYTPGTFQQYALSPANYVTPIPENLESAAAAPLLCAGVTVYSALRKSSVQSGEWVVILGAGGGLGHLGCQIASRGMAMRVIGVDAPEKQQLVLDSGAEHFIGLGSGDLPEQVMALTGGHGAQACLVLSGANAAYAAAPPLIKFGGRVVCVGIPEGDCVAIATAYPQMLIAKEQSIVGVAVGNRKDAIDVLELASRGLVKTHFRIDKLENLTQIFEDMHSHKLHGRVVIDLAA